MIMQTISEAINAMGISQDNDKSIRSNKLSGYGLAHVDIGSATTLSAKAEKTKAASTESEVKTLHGRLSESKTAFDTKMIEFQCVFYLVLEENEFLMKKMKIALDNLASYVESLVHKIVAQELEKSGSVNKELDVALKIKALLETRVKKLIKKSNNH